MSANSSSLSSGYESRSASTHSRTTQRSAWFIGCDRRWGGFAIAPAEAMTKWIHTLNVSEPMKGYIQDQSIVLIEPLPTDIKNGDEVEVIIKSVKRQEQSNPKPRLGLTGDYDRLARQWDNISDQLATQLKTEFSSDDQTFAETALYCSSFSEEA